MPQTTITFRTDPQTKEHFDAFCSEVGMNASVALNMFMKATVSAGELPFRVMRRKPVISDAQFWSGANLARLERSKAHAEAGMLSAHELISENPDD